MCSGSANKWPSQTQSVLKGYRRRRQRQPMRHSRNNERESTLINHIITSRNSAKLLAQSSLLLCCLILIIDQRKVFTWTTQYSQQNGYPTFNSATNDLHAPASNQTNATYPNNIFNTTYNNITCPSGLLTFELATGFIYKPASAETLAMMPSTLQLTDCLDYCLQNSSCLAINFEMGLCVLLSSSAKQNPQNLYSSQFPVFTIYAEKKCLLQGEEQATKQRHRCQRAWTFERVAGYEMKTRPRRRLKVASKELCMESCLLEREFECRSANWYRLTNECTLSDQDRHSVSQSEAGDQQIKGSLHDLYGPSNLTAPASSRPTSSAPLRLPQNPASGGSGLYQNYYMAQDRLRLALAAAAATATVTSPAEGESAKDKTLSKRSIGIRSIAATSNKTNNRFQYARHTPPTTTDDSNTWPPAQYVVELPAQAPVDYLENNCIYEPNKLCEFRKIQNRVLKTVDSIYQDIGSLDECKQKCLNAPYRCYSFDYGDTSERVCRTSHLDQASLLSVKEPYLDVVGAITYELASCFNVTIQCRAREMVAQVSSSKMFRGKIYVKSRPSSCVNDIRESLKFELAMKYHDENCDVRASSNSQQGVFSNDIVIQHHDRIVTTQDVGLSVYCQYDLGNRSITNNVDLAIDRIDEASNMEGKTQPGSGTNGQRTGNETASGSLSSPLTITSLATTVVRSPNVTMRITNMNGQPMTSATVGDRLALLFEIKEKTSPFGIFVREIVAMDGKQVLAAMAANKNNNSNNNGQRRGSPGAGAYHYAPSYNDSASLLSNESAVENMFQANKANSIQFIDSDGCPTDANIMGPLVKMDPSGHRVLAPFDAFKFPTSDMVFFRAVVTSCVSECKPVVCPPQPGSGGSGSGGGSFASGLGRGDSPDSQFTTTTELVTTTASLPTTTVAQFDQLITTTLGTTSGRNMIAGLRGQQQQPAPSTAVTTTQQPPLTDSPIMITSHHESPPTKHWSQQHRQAAAAGNDNAPFTVSLDQQRGDSLTTVPGFGTTETPVWKQVNNNQQPSLKNNHSSNRPTITTSDKEYLPINNQFSDSLNEQKRQQLVKLFESKLKQQLGNNYNSSNSAKLASEMFQIYKHLASLRIPPVEPPSGETDVILGHRLVQNIELNPLEMLLFKVFFQALTENPQQPVDAKMTEDSMNEFNKTIDNISGSKSSSVDMMQLIDTYNEAKSRTRKQLVPVGEEPLPNGAFRSFGKRKRKKRAVGAKIESVSSGYIRLNQDQHNQETLAQSHDSLSSPEVIRFTRSTVEMYHTHLANSFVQTSQAAAGARREKREAQPFYEMDELVVQSIKIVDRLHFQDEEKEWATTTAASRRKAPARSSLVTKWRNGIGNQTASSLEISDSGLQGDFQQVDVEIGEQKAELHKPRLISWSNSSVLTFLVIASSFVLLQILLVLVCLTDWNRGARTKQSLSKQCASSLMSSLSRNSTIASRFVDTPPTLTCYYETDSSQRAINATSSPPHNTISTPSLLLYDVAPAARALGRREATTNNSRQVITPVQLPAAGDTHYYASVRHQEESPSRYRRGNLECTDCFTLSGAKKSQLARR